MPIRVMTKKDSINPPLKKLFGKTKTEDPTIVFVIANIVYKDVDCLNS